MATKLHERDFDEVKKVLREMVVCPIDKHAVEGVVM